MEHPRLHWECGLGVEKPQEWMCWPLWTGSAFRCHPELQVPRASQAFDLFLKSASCSFELVPIAASPPGCLHSGISKSLPAQQHKAALLPHTSMSGLGLLRHLVWDLRIV